IHGHDAEDISDAEWEGLNNRIKTAYRDPLWPERVLRERTHVQWAINDVDGFNMNRSLFLPAIKFDYLLRVNSEEGRKAIKEMDGAQVATFDEYTDFLDSKVQQVKSEGAVALKTVTPYYRGFDYEPVSSAKARSAFRKSGKATPAQQKVVEDFAFHRIIAQASKVGLPIQIHTGLLAWNQIYLPHCDPVQLNKIFLQYPKCTFILFHGGYPYTEETGVLARTFPNVYLDFCWLPWITPYGTVRSLHEWLDIVPHNKLMWGGDSHRAECVHGHWLLAQEAVVKVLAERMAYKVISADGAQRTLKGIFRNNAIDLFGLKAEKQ
ncbi:MAG TPA: amidohydrolase family protein, partial [Bacteroidota bacterium]